MSVFCQSPVPSNSTEALDSLCHLELVNTAVSSCHAYITVLILLYLRCSKRRDDQSGTRKFVCHSLRALLSLLLLLTHLTEISAALLGSQGLLSSCAALLAWAAAQLLYWRAEADRDPRYLLVTLVFWLACGLARAASLFSALDAHLGIQHVAPITAAAASSLCYALVVVDVVSLVFEFTRGYPFTSIHQMLFPLTLINFNPLNRLREAEEVPRRYEDFVSENSAQGQMSNSFVKTLSCGSI
ncbi:hypothetical protein J6590_081007 [Homalodisca vitripennis]|nr:hypothetical protein J6590_081007 [Homalodisca vitripennis]